MNEENEPGKPIVTRRQYFCADCGKEYRNCKCQIYVSESAVRYPDPKNQSKRAKGAKEARERPS